MKHIIFQIVCLFIFTAIAVGQDMPPPPSGPDGGFKQGRGERIEALYVAFITNELALTEEEAQKFWPIHAQFDKELKGLDKNKPELEKQEAMLNIKKRYQDRFSKVIGGGRTDDFYRKDDEFRKRLVERLQQMKERKGGRGGKYMNRPPRGPRRF